MDFSELIAAADPSIFTESIKAWVSGLNINSVIMLIMMIFMIVGAIDRIRGNKLGYGEKFEDGFNAIGGLAIAMAGVYAAAPVLSMVLGPIISPIYTAIGRRCLYVRHHHPGLRHGRLPSGHGAGQRPLHR